MEYLCPLCNGLYTLEKKCSFCQKLMNDGGRIQDYYDNYSPYLNYDITDVMDGEPEGICQHIFTCPECRCDDIVNIKKLLK